MHNIIKFPVKMKHLLRMPKKRVFYIGYRYVGPMFCQDIQQLYLKRKGYKNGTRHWSIITYCRYDESNSKTYSFELEECEEKDVLDMVNALDLEEQISIGELREMGWVGKTYDNNVIKSIYHRSYDGLDFPDFVQPLSREEFGSNIMAQVNEAEHLLKDKKVHSYIRLEHSCENWVLMNLKSFDGQFVKARPVRLKSSHQTSD